MSSLDSTHRMDSAKYKLKGCGKCNLDKSRTWQIPTGTGRESSERKTEQAKVDDTLLSTCGAPIPPTWGRWIGRYVELNTWPVVTATFPHFSQIGKKLSLFTLLIITIFLSLRLICLSSFTRMAPSFVISVIFWISCASNAVGTPHWKKWAYKDLGRTASLEYFFLLCSMMLFLKL